MSSSLLITFATLLEAKESIDLLGAVKIDQYIWEFSKGKIVITGMGMLHTLLRLSETLQFQRPFAIWNLGFAADLRDRDIGTLVEVSCLCRPTLSTRCDKITNQIHNKCYPEIQLSYPRRCDKLVTVDAPVHSITAKRKYALYADLIDLEGYAIAGFARFHQIDCQVIKIVSDFAQRGGRKLLFANGAFLAQKLAHWIEKKLR